MSTSDGGRLTTHVLDTAAGRPAAGLAISLFRIDGDSRNHLKTAWTNADGRCDEPLLDGDSFVKGDYELVFHAGDYFRGQGLSCRPRPSSTWCRSVSAWRSGRHYHVPLLISPYGYSTYRGS